VNDVQKRADLDWKSCLKKILKKLPQTIAAANKRKRLIPQN